MTPLVAFLLIVVGVALVIVDVFVPTFGAMTLAGLGLIAWSVYSLFQVSPLVGWAAMGFAVLVLAASVAVAWRLFKHSPFIHRARVENEPLPSGEDAVLEGAIGEAATSLRPSGKVRVGERVHDAICESGMVPAGARVRVVAARRWELVVREAAPGDGEGAS